VIQLESPHTSEFKKRIEKISNHAEKPTTGIDIAFRRGDIRFFLLHPEKRNECARLWTLLFTSPSSKVHSILQETLKTWIYPEVAMFLLFIAKELSFINSKNISDLLRITDPDFLRLCPTEQKVNLLTDWFLEQVHHKLEATHFKESV